jgi:hypothetical protein
MKKVKHKILPKSIAKADFNPPPEVQIELSTKLADNPFWTPPDTKFTTAVARHFIALLEKGVHPYDACDTLKVKPAVVYELKRENKKFREAWDEASRFLVARLEQVAFQMATGYMERVVKTYADGSREVTETNKVDTGMIKFLLMAYDPERFKKDSHGGSGDVNHNVMIFANLPHDPDDDIKTVENFNNVPKLEGNT